MTNQKIETAHFLNNAKLKVSSYKCFGESCLDLPEINRFNLLVGRNNVGKTTLLNCYQWAFTAIHTLEELQEKALVSYVIPSTFQITEDQMLGAPNGPIFHSSALAAAARQVEVVTQREANSRNLKILSIEGKNSHISNDELLKLIRSNKKSFTPVFSLTSTKWTWSQLSAERDIRTEPLAFNEAQDIQKVKSNGENFTSAMEFICNHHHHQKLELLEGPFLNALNEVLTPDSDFRRIRVLRTENLCRIVLEHANRSQIALDDMGSGVKTVLLVLFNMLVLPVFKNDLSIDNFVFAFEELENNLHPTTIRRLFSYIRKRCLELGALLFITTHSNIVVDLVSNWEDSSVTHLQKTNSGVIASSVKCRSDSLSVLDDLGVRASDLLLSNSVIWVEGPSDAILIEKWLSLMSGEKKLRKGVEYSFVFYGGTNQHHLAFSEEVPRRLIDAFRLCRQNIFVADSNRTKEDDAVQVGASRLASEIDSPNISWITRGREIENYIPKPVLERILEIEIPDEYRFADIYKLHKEAKGRASELNKKDFVLQVVEQLTITDCDVLDLKEKLRELIGVVCNANGI